MAFTVSHLASTVFGNKRVRFLRITADGADGAAVTGLSSVEAHQMSPQSMATASARIKMNVSSAGTATNGSVSISGVASGDIFLLTAIGA